MLTVLQGILWAIFGAIIYREKIVNLNVSKLLGDILYWIGVPLQIFYLARNSSFEQVVWLPPVVTVVVLILGLGLSLMALHLLKQLFFGSEPCEIISLSELKSALLKEESGALSTKVSYNPPGLPLTNAGKGSFILASILGNTGFIGLTLIPPLVSREYWSWIVLYGLAHNVLGSYGIGNLIAEHYSSYELRSNWLNQLQNLFLLPSLWSFAYGYFSRDLALPDLIERMISQGVNFIVPGAFILTGMQLSKLPQWQNLRSGIFPAMLKMIILPSITGLLLTFCNIQGESRLVLVLMSSMPTAFASIILAEVYDLERNIAASSILISTLFMPIILFLWLRIF
jgi:malate permease and related proteins